MSERRIIDQVLVAASRWGARLFRNNVGQFKTDTGRVIRYGVCNPGGSDLIGWVPVEITPEMVGKTVAVFIAAEVKTKTVRVSGYQRKFLDAVERAGGVAVVVRDPADLRVRLEEAGYERRDRFSGAQFSTLRKGL